MGWVFGLVGLAVGSFLNVCIDRLPQGESILSPPSRCARCGQRLPARDLIPLLSYVLRRGRCRFCGAAIPLRLMAVELTTGATFAFLWQRYGPGWPLLWTTLYACFLIVIFVIDLKHRLVLNRVIYPAIILALLATPFTPGHNPVELLAGGIVGGGLLLLVHLAYPDGMGQGDVKLGAFIGLTAGFPAIVLGLFVAVVLGGTVAGGLLLSGLKGRKDPIPFAPFLATGGMAAILYGQEVMSWYTAMLFRA